MGVLSDMDGTDSMNNLAFKLVNEMRKVDSIKPRQMETQEMLGNTLRHSEAQQLKGSLYDQNMLVYKSRSLIVLARTFLVARAVSRTHLLLTQRHPFFAWQEEKRCAVATVWMIALVALELLRFA